MGEQSSIEWLVNQLILENELTIKGENLKLIEIAKQKEKDLLEKLKDFDTWKEWKNNKQQ
jgi:hypothetical protein